MPISARYRAYFRKSGFTLLELVVVIALIAILSVVGISVFVGLQKNARDTKRKADIDAIAKSYEAKKVTGGAYLALSGQDFSSGSIPKDPSKGDYFNVMADDGSGFKTCAALEANPLDSCNTPAQNCFCKSSSQGNINPGSSLTGTNVELGLGGSSSSSCDTNGTLLSGLVGYWKMDEEPGSTSVIDQFNGKNGSVNGAAGLASSGRLKFGNTGQFNLNDENTGTILVSGTADSYDFGTNDFTLSAWVKMPSKPHATVIHKGYGSNAFILLGQDADNGLYPSFRIAYSHYQGGVLGNKLINDDVWHLLTAIRKGTTNSIYIDGDSPVSRTEDYIDEISVASDDNLDIGSMGSSFFMKGSIDDVRIYNRALSEVEVKSLYNDGNGCLAP